MDHVMDQWISFLQYHNWPSHMVMPKGGRRPILPKLWRDSQAIGQFYRLPLVVIQRPLRAQRHFCDILLPHILITCDSTLVQSLNKSVRIYTWQRFGQPVLCWEPLVASQMNMRGQLRRQLWISASLPALKTFLGQPWATWCWRGYIGCMILFSIESLFASTLEGVPHPNDTEPAVCLYC